MRQAFFSAKAGNSIVAVAATVCFLLIGAPKADAAGSKWYVGASVPVMYIDDTDTVTQGSNIDPSQPLAPPSTYRGKAVNKYDTGFKLEGVIGYEFRPNMRIELELFYSEAEVDKLTYSGISTVTPLGPVSLPGETETPVSGDAEQIGAMLNLWYDIDLGSKWTPYVGVGVGVIEVDFGEVDYDENALAQYVSNSLRLGAAQQMALQAGVPFNPANVPLPQLPPGFVPGVSTTDTVFAYQAAAGVSYQFSDNVALRLGYRYQTSDDLQFRGRNAFGNTVETKTDFDVQFIEIGVRYHF
ncbi:MAG: outer membrane beta-barrel protein [Gammaproteobacteria bacterium]|nr:outer membrane beta-barrel protein [Gammaproteobacteria bacterium]